MDPPVVICIRKTLNWDDLALVEAQIRPKFRPKYQAWNATFTVPYHVFRQRLKEIAHTSLSRVEGAMCVELEDAPPDAIVVPVDDDDWFAPHLAQRLRAWFHAGLDGYHWRPAAVGRRLPFRDRYTCMSNNHAFGPGSANSLALSHTKASEYFDAHPARVRYIPEFLSIQNRSMASQTTLAFERPVITRNELVASLRRHRGLYANWRLRPELNWAQPYIDEMDELMAEVHLRRG